MKNCPKCPGRMYLELHWESKRWVLTWVCGMCSSRVKPVPIKK